MLKHYPRTPLDLLVTSATLHQLSVHRNTAILDLIAEDQLEHSVELKNVCAKVSPQLSDRIDEICSLLDIRKRSFLEAAFIEACNEAERIIKDEGLYAALTGEDDAVGEV